LSGTLELVGVGNALVDVVAFTDEDVAAVLGLHPGKSVHIDSQRFAELLVSLPAPTIGAGGGAANTVKTASRLGVRAAFVGRVGAKSTGGADRFAQLFEKEMRDAGVQAILARGTEPTGGCLVLRLPDGTAAIAASPAAALGLDADDIPEELVRQAKVLVLDGYVLGRKTLVERALSLAERYGTAVALDVGSAALAAEFAPFIAKLSSSAPLILFMNRPEALIFASTARAAGDIDEDDAYEYLESLADSGPYPIIVVKRGALGALVFAGGGRFESPASPVVPKDETGAGDSFAAGFLAAWVRDRALADCAAFGNRVAREAVAVSGTRIPPNILRRLAKSLA